MKIIAERRNAAQIKHIAITLEAESGGLLVSIDKTTQGYAIILYRGKNYQRPNEFRPKNLLTKRQALARSIELQRREVIYSNIIFRSQVDVFLCLWYLEIIHLMDVC